MSQASAALTGFEDPGDPLRKALEENIAAGLRVPDPEYIPTVKKLLSMMQRAARTEAATPNTQHTKSSQKSKKATPRRDRTP